VPDIGFVNGRFMPLEEAQVPVEDRGFQFGDGVYEVIRTYGGRPFEMDAHLARLERSAAAIDLAWPYDRAQWGEWVCEGLRRGGHEESKVYLQLTRGVAPRDHPFPRGGAPTVVMTVRALAPLDPKLRESGISAITVEDLRWGRCDIKSVNLLPNVMARQRAREAGATEAIFVRGDEVIEGAVSNVMIVKDGTVLTAPEDRRILAGVTRRVVLDLARKHGIAVCEWRVSTQDLREADEVFATGTTVEVVPIVRVDGRPVGTGHPGPVAADLHARFCDFVARGPR
jgi:D-alanine transaminase